MSYFIILQERFSISLFFFALRALCEFLVFYRSIYEGISFPFLSVGSFVCSRFSRFYVYVAQAHTHTSKFNCSDCLFLLKNTVYLFIHGITLAEKMLILLQFATLKQFKTIAFTLFPGNFLLPAISRRWFYRFSPLHIDTHSGRKRSIKPSSKLNTTLIEMF